MWLTFIFSVITSQQQTIARQQKMIMLRDQIILQQNEASIMLVKEIERVRETVTQLSSQEIEKILTLIHSDDVTVNSSRLISASQLLQVVMDENMLPNILAMENGAEQRAVYNELMVSDSIGIRNFFGKVFNVLPIITYV